MYMTTDKTTGLDRVCRLHSFEDERCVIFNCNMRKVLERSASKADKKIAAVLDELRLRFVSIIGFIRSHNDWRTPPPATHLYDSADPRSQPNTIDSFFCSIFAINRLIRAHTMGMPTYLHLYLHSRLFLERYGSFSVVSAAYIESQHRTQNVIKHNHHQNVTQRIATVEATRMKMVALGAVFRSQAGRKRKNEHVPFPGPRKRIFHHKEMKTEK
jgi:hypothetical protein